MSVMSRRRVADQKSKKVEQKQAPVKQQTPAAEKKPAKVNKPAKEK